DDVCLISNDPLNLQQIIVLNIAQSYADTWHYSFNTEKSVILVIGESSTSRQTAQLTRSFYLAGKKLREVDSAKHLGVIISNSTSHLNRATQISSSFRNAFLILFAIIVGTCYSQLNPAMSLFLVKSFCLPILTFSFCIWSPPQSVIVILERIWLKCLRTLLGLPPHSPTLGIHKLLDLDRVNLPNPFELFHNANFHNMKVWKCLIMTTLHLSWHDHIDSTHSSHLTDIARIQGCS
uniref:Reverse transcriptase domain-containing protein n=2 Tax=Amphimedon queenslandica TaxID=400682 RepID=A0A1X7SE00_AMPQE